MGSIINFPKSRSKSVKRKTLDNILIDKLPDFEQHCNIGNVNVTCATCNNVSHFKFDQAVFRVCEFYCSSCGTGYKLSNPLFGNKNKAKHNDY